MKKLILAVLTSSAIFTATPAYAGGLSTPVNLKVDEIACGEAGKHNAYATLSWDPVKFATSYRFYSKIADGQDTYRSYGDDVCILVGKRGSKMANRRASETTFGTFLLGSVHCSSIWSPDNM